MIWARGEHGALWYWMVAGCVNDEESGEAVE